MVGHDVGRPCGDHHRGGEVDLLPAARRFVGEGGGGEQVARRAPQIRHMRAGVQRTLVESDPRDRPGRGGLELDAEFHRIGIVQRDRGRRIASRTDSADRIDR